MSDYGEIGYLNASTAAECCYRTVQQCHLVVLIIGTRYGSVNKDGFSITHREYRESRSARIPTITLVDTTVLSYKDVFDADPKAEMWSTFPRMDNAKRTFDFISEISESPTNNGIVPFSTAADAQHKLKLQIANFMGDRLSEAVPRFDHNLREVLAEIKTLRNQMMRSTPETRWNQSEAQKYLSAAKFILSPERSSYYSAVESMFGNGDSAISSIMNCNTLEDVVKASNSTFTIIPAPDPDNDYCISGNDDHPSFSSFFHTESSSEPAIIKIYRDQHHIKLSQSAYDEFDQIQRELAGRLS